MDDASAARCPFIASRFARCSEALRGLCQEQARGQDLTFFDHRPHQQAHALRPGRAFYVLNLDGLQSTSE